MSTIVEFRRARDEAALERLNPHAGEDVSACAAASRASEHTAEIILFPRTRRAAPKREGVRKPLKRRFALRAAVGQP